MPPRPGSGWGQGWGWGSVRVIWRGLLQADHLLQPVLVLHHLDLLLLVEQVGALAPVDLEEARAHDVPAPLPRRVGDASEDGVGHVAVEALRVAAPVRRPQPHHGHCLARARLTVRKAGAVAAARAEEVTHHGAQAALEDLRVGRREADRGRDWG